jgi:hypothetical protein
MNSYNVQVHSETTQLSGSDRKRWATPVIEVIALDTAQGGVNPSNRDHHGHFGGPRS